MDLEEKIQDIEKYNPSEASDAQLRDDARIVQAWYATYKDPNRDIKFTKEQITKLATRIWKEIVRRKKEGKIAYTIHPDRLKEASRELYELANLSKSDRAILENEDTKEVVSNRYNEAIEGIQNQEDTVLIPDFISIAGGAIESENPDDLDLIIRGNIFKGTLGLEKEDDDIYENEYKREYLLLDMHHLWIPLRKVLDPNKEGYLQIHDSPEGPHASSIPIADLILRWKPKLEVEQVKESSSSKLVFIGTGAMDSPRKDSSILVAKGNEAVLFSAGPDIKADDIPIMPQKILLTGGDEEDLEAGKRLAEGFEIEAEHGGKYDRAFKAEPFEVRHTDASKTYGYRIFIDDTKIAYIPEFLRLSSEEWDSIKNFDIGIFDGSSWSRDIIFTGRTGGHQAVKTTIEEAKRAGIKSIYFVHIGKTTEKHTDDVKEAGGILPDDNESISLEDGSDLQEKQQRGFTIQRYVFQKEHFPSRNSVRNWLKQHNKTGTIIEGKTTWAARIKDPNQCTKGSYRTFHIAEGISGVGCKLKATKDLEEGYDLVAIASDSDNLEGSLSESTQPPFYLLIEPPDKLYSVLEREADQTEQEVVNHLLREGVTELIVSDISTEAVPFLEQAGIDLITANPQKISEVLRAYKDKEDDTRKLDQSNIGNRVLLRYLGMGDFWVEIDDNKLWINIEGDETALPGTPDHIIRQGEQEEFSNESDSFNIKKSPYGLNLNYEGLSIDYILKGDPANSDAAVIFLGLDQSDFPTTQKLARKGRHIYLLSDGKAPSNIPSEVQLLTPGQEVILGVPGRGVRPEKSFEEKAVKKLTPGKMNFTPLKSKSGYGTNEFSDPNAAWETWAQGYDTVSIGVKYDGFRVIPQRKGNTAYLFSEDAKRNLIKKLPEIEKALLDLPDGDFILDGELMLYAGEKWEGYQKGEKIERADMPSFLMAKKPPAKFNAQIALFDILYYDNKDLHNETWEERQKYLRKILPKDTKHLIREKPIQVATKSEFLHAVKQKGNKKNSEGAMLKYTKSKYPLTGRTRAWAKVKHFKELRVKVIDKKETAKDGTWVYTVEIGDGYRIGKTYATDIKANIGDILELRVAEVKYHPNKPKDKQFTFDNPIVHSIKPKGTALTTPEQAKKLAKYKRARVKEEEEIKPVGEWQSVPLIKKAKRDLGEEGGGETRSEAARKKWEASWYKVWPKSGKGEFVIQHHWRGLSKEETEKDEKWLVENTNHSVHGDIRFTGRDPDSDEKALWGKTLFTGNVEDVKEHPPDPFIYLAQHKSADFKVQIGLKLPQPLAWLRVGREKPFVSTPSGPGATSKSYAKFFALSWGKYEMGTWRLHNQELFLDSTGGENVKGRLLLMYAPVGGRRIWLADFPEDQRPYSKTHDKDKVIAELKKKKQKYLIWVEEPGDKPELIEI